MSDQLVLFAEPTARATDPPTSHAAANAVESGRIENRVLERFAIHGAMTDEELAARSPQWHGPTLLTCRSRLAKRGLLVADGVKKNSRNRDMTIWRLP